MGGNDEFIDPLNDPRFPDRPQNPEYWKLSNVLLWIDGEVREGGKTFNDVLTELGLDAEMVVYVAQHRTANGLVQMGIPLQLLPVVAATWIDAFCAGIKHERDRAAETG